MFLKMASSRRKIKIMFQGRPCNYFVNGSTLKKQIIRENFPDGGRLTYKLDGEEEDYLLDCDIDNYILVPNTNIYKYEVQGNYKDFVNISVKLAFA